MKIFKGKQRIIFLNLNLNLDQVLQKSVQKEIFAVITLLNLLTAKLFFMNL